MRSVAQGKESWNRRNSSEHFRPYLISLRGRLGWAGAGWACNLWTPSVSVNHCSIIHCSIAFNMTCQFLLTFCGTSIFAVNKTNAMQRYAKCTCNAGRPGGSMFDWTQCQVITRDRQGKLPFGTQTRLAGLNRAWIPNARETDMKKKPIAYIVHFLHKLIN